MNETRRRISAYVRSHPGVYYTELRRTLNLANGQVQYHLKRLLADKRVTEERLYGKTHYYPPEYDAWERGALALLRRETAGDIVSVLLSEGPTRPDTVAEELDIARSTLEWHLDHLIEQDVVEKRRDDRNHVTLTLNRPDTLVRLLWEADPSLYERMVDRFTRLVDLLLSE